MEVWEQRLDQLRDEVADYAHDWAQYIDSISQADTPDNERELLEYLEQVVPHLKQMRRELGYVTYQPKSRCYLIHNYTFSTYQWAKRRAFNQMVIQPGYIAICVDELSATEQEQLRKRLLP